MNGSCVRAFLFVLLTLGLPPSALSLESRYCTVSYAVAVTRAQYYDVSCGWWGKRRCGRYRYYTAYETRQNHKACCDGYRGAACDIPICDPPCANTGLCLDKDHCECPSGFADEICTTVVCSWKQDCYPGVCSGESNCTCSSEFSGPNCQTMLDAPTFPGCIGSLVKKEGSKLTPLGEATCGNDVTYTSQKYDLTHVAFDYRVSYPRLRDLPLVPEGGYLKDFRIGIIHTSASARLLRPDNSSVWDKEASCTSDARQRNPQEFVVCSMIAPVDIPPSHGDRLEMEMTGTTGGFKEVREGEAYPTYETRDIIGSNATQIAIFKFDLKAPHHCLTSNTCANDSGSPVDTGSDVTQNKTIQIAFFGWEDDDSRLGMIFFDLYSMSVNPQGQLEESGPSLMTGRWDSAGMAYLTELTLPSPGLFSVVARVMDTANNTAYARGLVLYDPSSELIVKDQSLRVMGAPRGREGAFWVSTTQNPSVETNALTVSWAGRYGNSFYTENDLLAEVKPFENGMDDHHGNRTQAAVPNVDGVVRFEYSIDPLVSVKGGRAGGDQTRATPTWRDVTPVTDHLNLSLPRDDGDRFRFHLRATDLVGHVHTDEMTIRVDSSPPIVTPNSASFHPNTGHNVWNFYSRVDVAAEDEEGGIHKIKYKLYDVTSGKKLVASLEQEGQILKQTSCGGASNCLCTKYGECFPRIQQIHIHNCVLKDHMNRQILLQADVLNSAGLPGQFEKQLGVIRNLTGIKWYPAPSNMTIAKDYGYGVQVTWNISESCYEIFSLNLMLSGATERTMVFPGSNTTMLEIEDLLPLHQYSLQIQTYYVGGHVSSPATVDFITKESDLPGGESNNVAVIVGGVIGGIVFLALVVCVTLVVIRMKTTLVLPRYLDRATRNVIDRLSRVPIGLTELDIRGPDGNAIDNHLMIGNTAYVSRPQFLSAEDDIYAYGELQTDPSASWKHSEEKVIMGKTLVVGRFAEIKMATLVSSEGKTQVVAKLLSPGSNDEDLLLMKAKMNFMAQGVDPHPNIVNFVGAVAEGTLAPMLLLEHCEIGLRDWLKSHNSSTNDVADELVEFCLGIARAVEFLHGQEILHRRLGTRNVLLKTVGDRLTPKVTGFGPMKGEQEGRSAEEARKAHIPVKWMAPEQLGLKEGETRRYTKMSDSWAYAITVWEIYSNGAVPYGDKKNSDVIMFVCEGERLLRPPACPENMFDEIIIPCWNEKPEARMTLANIRSTIQTLFYSTGQGDYYGSDCYGSDYNAVTTCAKGDNELTYANCAYSKSSEMN